MDRPKSTTVRPNTTSGKTAALRAGLGILERVSPQVGGRVAARVWFTLPPRSRISPTSATDTGRPFGLDVAGTTVRGRVSGVSGAPTVLLVHGWGGHSGQFRALVDPLVAAGFRAVGFDGPSHGASDPGRYGPRQSSAVELAEALLAIGDLFGPIDAVVAHSLGALSSGYAVQRGLEVSRLALVAPMVDAPSYTAPFVTALGAGPRIRRQMVAAIETRIGRRLADFDLTLLPLSMLPPTLLVHDEVDPETRYEDTAELARMWPQARLVTTRGLGHRRILRNPGVVTEVVGFLTGVPAGTVDLSTQHAGESVKNGTVDLAAPWAGTVDLADARAGS